MWRCVAGLLLYAWAMTAGASSLAIDGKQAWPVRLAPYLQILEDPAGRLGLDDVLSARGFAPADTSTLRPGFTRSTWWLDLSMSNTGPQTQALRLNLGTPRLPHVEFHLQRAGPWSTVLAGLGHPARFDPWREPTLAFDLAPGESVRILVKVSGGMAIQMQPQLYSAQALEHADAGITFVDSILLGGLVALALYAMLLWLTSRDWTFLFQMLTYFAFCMYQAAYRGYAKMYFWPEAGEWAIRSMRLFGVLFPAMFVLYVLLLSRRENLQMRGRRLLLVLAIGLAALAALSLWGDLLVSGWLVAYGVLISTIGMSVVGILFAKSRPALAKLIFPTIGLVLMSVVLRVLQIEGFTPPLSLHFSNGLTIVELVVVLALLAAWVMSVRSGRAQAQVSLAGWQAEVQGRLRAEVERQTTALHRALGDAEEINREQTRTMAYVGHDLRAPLTTILGYTRSLYDLVPGHQRQVRAIARSAQYQLALIDELLEYAKGELHSLAVEPEPVRLAALLDDIAQYAAALATQQDNRFLFEPGPDLPDVVMLDARRLQQVLLNLLSNAAKFTRGGEIRLLVSAEPAAPGWRLQFAVTDTGVGIGDEAQSRIFEAFQQVQRAGGGVGLGLFIARRIVATMGGELEVESSPDQGSTFRFHILTAAPEGEVAEEGHPIGEIVPPAALSPSVLLGFGQPSPDFLAADERRELIGLARGGQVTDLERWAVRVGARYPHASEFFEAVKTALDDLDLDGILALARAE